MCLFAQMAVRRFVDDVPIAGMFQRHERGPINQGQMDSFRQEIGKVACRQFDENQLN